jgi:NAD(P)H-dependent flavin oxidoreductase YrpB (nitropropane dioxygenase family)
VSAPASSPPAPGPATHPALRTRLCELAGIAHPIVQTGMGFVAFPELAAAVSNAGGLGIVAAATMSLAELEAAVARMGELTDRPYGVNLRSDAPDLMDRARVMIDGGVRVASFALAPSREAIDRFKEAGVACIPSIGARRHAEKVASWGVDAVIVQGGEGGGHTGPVPTTVLLPQVVDAVDIPVVAAGGFFDGRGLVAALAYGAAGIAMGTRFLLTQESPVPEAMKRAYLERGVTDTVVTSKVDGQPHRMIRTAFVDDIERSSAGRDLGFAARNALRFQRMSGRPWREIVQQGLNLKRQQGYSWKQVVMAANAPMLCRAAMVDGRDDVGILSSGQVVGLLDDLPTCAELVERIVATAGATLTRLAATPAVVG